jgi:hypothetical protein
MRIRIYKKIIDQGYGKKLAFIVCYKQDGIFSYNPFSTIQEAFAFCKDKNFTFKKYGVDYEN